MAVAALAVLCALHTRVEALTVLFAAQRFFARAFAGWHIRRYSWEIAWLPVVYNASGFEDFLLVAHGVVAADAGAGLSTGSPFGKAFTVEFKTIYFSALAARVLMRAGG